MAASQTDYGLPSSPKIPSHIKIRAATTADAKGMAECFFTSFWPSHLFWTHEFSPRLWMPWWVDAWTMGIEKDTTMRTFVAVDTTVTDPYAKNLEDGRCAAFTRWRAPQKEDKHDEMWPELPKGVDDVAMGAFFGGMEKNRKELMKGGTFWFLQMLGTEVEYQGMGIGTAFVGFGCDLADKDDMEVYIDASEKGAPFYQNHFGAVPRADILIPEKPKLYEKFNYISHVRPKKSERGTNGHAS